MILSDCRPSVTLLELFLDWIVYIVQAKNGQLYTGVTTDVARRIRQHSGEIKGGAKYFRGNPPKYFWKVGEFSSRSDAQKEEVRIKKLSRLEKKRLLSRETRNPS